MTTRAPSSAKRSAVALPMPAAPPVTSTTLSFIRMEYALSLCSSDYDPYLVVPETVKWTAWRSTSQLPFVLLQYLCEMSHELFRLFHIGSVTCICDHHFFERAAIGCVLLQNIACLAD